MKKTIALILVVIFLMDLTSCHSYTLISSVQDYKANQDKELVYALDLITNKDSMVYFSSSFPGKLSNSEVTGLRHVLLRNFESDSVIYNKSKKQVKYALKNDIKYIVIYQNDTSLVCIASDTTRIPFSEIKQIHIKKIDSGSTVGLILAAGGALALVIYLIVVNLTFDVDMGGW
jgi:hypothetical protein